MALKDPNLADGIRYWSNVPATVDGVLGGYGTGTLPRVESLGSRLFLLSLLPELSTVESAIKPLKESTVISRRRVLDVGAGVGRVTADVLLHFFPDVLLLEPVTPFIQEAYNRAVESAGDPNISIQKRWRGLHDKSQSVTFVQGTLQSFDPSHPLKSSSVKLLNRVGYEPQDGKTTDIDSKFDVVWCQWCLGHLSDPELVDFFKRSHAALRDKRSLMVVKENVCSDAKDGGPQVSFDEEDSSLTRSDKAWKRVFQQANLKLVKEEVQNGLPEGLYVVKMYALR